MNYVRMKIMGENVTIIKSADVKPLWWPVGQLAIGFLTLAEEFSKSGFDGEPACCSSIIGHSRSWEKERKVNRPVSMLVHPKFTFLT